MEAAWERAVAEAGAAVVAVVGEQAVVEVVGAVGEASGDVWDRRGS
ncbi:hypothetical protein ACFVYR_00195 [Streptomyces sp. NPDC058284]